MKFTNKKTAVEYFRRCEINDDFTDCEVMGCRPDYTIIIDGAAVPTMDRRQCHLYPSLCLVREGRFYFIAQLY
jgi:hypothetical protein